VRSSLVRAAALVAAPIMLGSLALMAAIRTETTASLPQAAPTTTTTTTPAGLPAGDGPTTTTAGPPPATTVVAAPEAPVATTTTTTTAALSLSERGAQALALIDYPWQQTGYTIVFAGPRAGLLGLSSTSDRTVTVFIRTSQPSAAIARVLAHEIGHAVDFAFTTSAEREEYRLLRGLGTTPWYPDCGECSDYAYPAGDFAEVFTYWLLGPGAFRSTIGAVPTAAQLPQLAAIFASGRSLSAPIVVAPVVPTPTSTTQTPTRISYRPPS
jgi:hypothetical protein